jgi:hypothetical protein
MQQNRNWFTLALTWAGYTLIYFIRVLQPRLLTEFTSSVQLSISSY